MSDFPCKVSLGAPKLPFDCCMLVTRSRTNDSEGFMETVINFKFKKSKEYEIEEAL